MRVDFASKCRKFAAAIEKIDVEKIYVASIKETADLALDLNRVQMSELGVDAENKPLGQYTQNTKRIKRAKGQPTDHITLRDTGAFQDKMFLDMSKRPISIDSKDAKVGKIQKRWPKALGLISQFNDQYKDRVLTVFNGKIKIVLSEKKKILQ